MTSPIRVLHVEDDPDFAELVRISLPREAAYIEVTSAENADEGLQYLADGDFDCVVSDYDMPGRNGVEFLSAVREDWPDLPFVLFTGKGSETVASDAISANVSDYLQKSTDPKQFAILANRIETLVEGYRALRDAEAQATRIRSIFERVSDAFIAFDSDWRYTEVNPHAEELLRRPAEDLVGRTLWEVFPELRGTVFETALHAAMDHGETPHVEAVFEPLDAWFEVRPFPLETGISVYFRDITHRVERQKQLEKERNRLSVLFDRLPDPVVEYEFDGDVPLIRDMNPAFERVFGVNRVDGLGQSLDEVVVPSERRTEAARLNQRVIVGERLDNRVIRQTVDGPRPFLLRNSPIPEEDGVRGYTIYVDLEYRASG